MALSLKNMFRPKVKEDMIQKQTDMCNGLKEKKYKFSYFDVVFLHEEREK